MPKIAFMGAGSTVFVKNVVGDCMLEEPLKDAHIALYDIDAERLEDSRLMLERLNASVNDNRATITTHHGEAQRREALSGAGYVVNAVQVGGYRPCTVTDFEIPKKYGLRQTIGDTLGIGGIFRALRTVPVVLDFARDMQEVCPDAWFLNYVNPMVSITGALLEAGGVKTVGLCHSVQVCAKHLLYDLGIIETPDHDGDVQWKIAGINHMAWLLEVTQNGEDLYPEVKKRAFEKNAKARAGEIDKHGDMVRYEIMKHFGYYITESSEHLSEYLPYFIKAAYPGLVEEFKIPLDEYPRRCEGQIKEWQQQREELLADSEVTHKRSREYGAGIIAAMESGVPYRIHGNVKNHGFVPNLPAKAVVEVPCLVDRNGVQGCYVGELPEQLAALNRTNLNTHLMTVEAALTGSRDAVYQAAMLDPHTGSELPLDTIRALCDDLFEAHAGWLPQFEN